MTVEGSAIPSFENLRGRSLCGRQRAFQSSFVVMLQCKFILAFKNIPQLIELLPLPRRMLNVRDNHENNNVLLFQLEILCLGRGGRIFLAKLLGPFKLDTFTKIM